MFGSTQPLKDLLARLLAQPDEIMLSLGAGGELLVARLRALLSLLILAMPLIAALGGAKSGEVVIGLGLAVFTNLMAQIWLVLARRQLRYSWLSYATSTYDVSLTTLALALLALGDPVAATNSIVVWCFYLLAIALTALRNDGRLTLFVSALALVQYALLAAVVFSLAPAHEPLVSIDYGTALVATQVERLILILLMGVLTAALVYRMQRLVEMCGHASPTGPPHPFRQRAGAGGVRAAGGGGVLARPGARAAGFDRLRHLVGRHPGRAPDPDPDDGRADRGNRLPHAAAGGNVRQRQPHRPAQPRLAAAGHAADVRDDPQRWRFADAGIARPGPLQAHQRRDRPPRRRPRDPPLRGRGQRDRKSTRLESSH